MRLWIQTKAAFIHSPIRHLPCLRGHIICNKHGNRNGGTKAEAGGAGEGNIKRNS